jgi:hypothetical protein
MNNSMGSKNRIIKTSIGIILPIGIMTLLFSKVAWSETISPGNAQSTKPENTQTTKLENTQETNLVCGANWPAWIGFEQSKTKSISKALHSDGKTTVTTVENCQSGKTLWDVLGLIVVPISLAVLGFWFQKLQKRQFDKKADQEKEIADSKLREESVKNYLDKISELLIDKQLFSPATDDSTKQAILDVASGLTKSILMRLENDGERKGRVLQFLYKAKLLTNFKLDLVRADMSGAQLIWAKLEGANLDGVNLSNADLRGADLTRANLSSAILRGADLSTDPDLIKDAPFPYQFPTSLEGADLCNTDLRGAQLMRVNLRNANLGQADIEDADIEGADLTMDKIEDVEDPANIKFPLDINKVKSAKNWQYAKYNPDFRSKLVL